MGSGALRFPEGRTSHDSTRGRRITASLFRCCQFRIRDISLARGQKEGEGESCPLVTIILLGRLVEWT